MQTTRRLWTALWLGLAMPWASAQTGLQVQEAPASWARWQARVGLATAPQSGSASSLVSTSPWDGGLQTRGAQLMGDYYFTGAGPVQRRAWGGGFRATSGLLIGARLNGLAAGSAGSGLAITVSRSTLGPDGTDSGALPYVGVGYTGLSMRHGFSFTADLGLVGRQSGGGLRLNRANAGGQALDELVRDLRMTPVVQVGVSYTF